MIPGVQALIHEAGNPYYDWLYGDADASLAAVSNQLQLRTSEIWAGRVILLLGDSGLAGLFVALGGEELTRCRAADGLAALKQAGRSPVARSALAARMRKSRELFTPVAPDDFYLSKIGVVPGFRGTGVGRALLHHYLATGGAAGFVRFRLDVSAENAAAVELYRSAGFETLAVRNAEGMTYMSMALIRPERER